MNHFKVFENRLLFWLCEWEKKVLRESLLQNLSKKYEKQICDMNKTDPQRLKYISRFSSTIFCT